MGRSTRRFKRPTPIRVVNPKIDIETPAAYAMTYAKET